MLHRRLGLRGGSALAALFLLNSGWGCGSSDTVNDAPPSDGSADSSNASAGRAAESSGNASSGLQGSGESCQSYTEAADGMCASWYCGVTEAELMAAVDPNAKCGGNVPLLCAGTVTAAVGTCARRLKAENFNKTNDELRPLVRDCVYEDADIKAAVPEDCLDCTIDTAACAADNCLVQCLAGDSPTCDSCRRAANCDQSTFSCGGLPATIM